MEQPGLEFQTGMEPHSDADSAPPVADPPHDDTGAAEIETPMTGPKRGTKHGWWF